MKMPLCATLSLQLRVTVQDTGNPEKSAVTTVRIPVTRNVNSPKFEKQDYKGTVNENVDVGESVLKVSASDADNVSTGC